MAVLVAAGVLWMGLNSFADRLGFAAIDPPPLAWLETVSTLLALLLAALILATQRHADQLADRRAQLMLELALMAEKKAKLLALLEEFRRDHPNLTDRVDLESIDISAPADASAVLAEIDYLSETSG